MIKLENYEVMGWEHVIRGMRNPKNSWDLSDTDYRQIICSKCDTCEVFEAENWDDCADCEVEKFLRDAPSGLIIGPNDLDLMKRLSKAGSDHGKYLRMINVTVDITAPLYWWKEFDTYKVGTVANSCSTMHKLTHKEFELDDFSHEHLDIRTIGILKDIISALNDYRHLYVNYNANDFEVVGCPSKKDIWWQMIQLLPSSYNQKRTVQLNYQVLKNMYFARRYHKLDEWLAFCDWIKELPYSELITMEEKDK